MGQEVKLLKIEDLVLWTENPRDPIESTAKDQDIVDKALGHASGKWTLKKLAKEMGSYYDFSELPTVVYKGKKPIVYDGNRRIILGKLKHDLVKTTGGDKIDIPDIPATIPCNVCSEDIALKNILRKHADSGSWQPLERDIFLHNFMKEEKSPFLVLEEETGLISAHPQLNQGFVKDEVLKRENLKTMGFEIENNSLRSRHNSDEARSILTDVAKRVEAKEITTRKNRYKIFDVLGPAARELIHQNKQKPLKALKVDFGSDQEPYKADRRTRRTSKKNKTLFGEKLILKAGQVSDLYRDICDLYAYFQAKSATLSEFFPALIRMALRLLCETAAKDGGHKDLDEYLNCYFSSAKAGLDKDARTTLSTQNVSDATIKQLLHVGAHAYKAAANLEQTIAISLIVGKMLMESHKRPN